MDIKLNSLYYLEGGQNYSVIEVNGAGSEPTHIYDPKHSLWFGWKEIVWHWCQVQKISQHNSRNGLRYLKFRQGIAELRQNAALQEQLAGI